ncbi:MAG: hypothetical protein JST16_10225 [Bdellovibrionales bacterium]|nr:hypothetical protein [Bdellovibrionales bacterium]
MVLGFWLALFSASSAYAGITRVTGTYTVERSNCPVKTRWRWREEWHSYDQIIPEGTQVKGTRPQDKPDIVLFQMPGSEDFFAASWKCMFAKSAEEIERDEKTYSGWHLSVGLISWQETFDYTDSSGNVTKLRAETLGVCPGDGYLVRLHDFDLGFTGCLAFAKANVTARDAGSSLSYSQRNHNVFALIAGPEALWRPEATSVGLGIYLPLAVRVALWPEPDNSTVGETIRYMPGALLETRFERGSWSFSQRFGWIGSFSDYLWYFAINKDFR